MASLVAGPVDKDDLLEALSNRDGAAVGAAGVGDATLAEFSGLLGANPISEEEEGEQRDSFEDFLNEPESGGEGPVDDDEGQALQQLLSASDGDGQEGDHGYRTVGFQEPHAADSVRQPGGVLATYRDSNELQHSLGEQRTVKAVDRLRRAYAAKEKAAEDARGALADEEQKLRALRKQAEAGKLQDPARLGYQENEVGKAWGRLTECEKARDAAELALHRAQDVSDRADRNCAKEAGHHDAIAQERREVEVRRAKRALSQDAAARAAARERQRAAEEEEARKAAEARKHQAVGVRRLKDSLARRDERMQELEEVREHRFQHDAQRVVGLKSSMDAVGRQVQSSNEARRKKQQKVRAEQEARKQQLLNDGQNPYEVWRREEMDAEKERQKNRLKALNEIRSEKLLEQLMTEERTYKKNKAGEQTKRAQAEDFQKEMGRYAKEKKVAAYIRKMTIGNVDVLDPTGTAMRIDASKVTVQKTHAFGLGRAPPSEIDKVDKDLTRTKRVLEKKKPVRPGSADSIGSGELGPVDAGGGGTEDGSNLGDRDHAELPEGKLWAPKLTKLEQQYLDAAKERQKQNITSVQRCWGKEFKGDAFLAKPSVIAFDDFEVGKKYRQVVEVTNVSLTFNQFKLLPLDDKVKDFFEIQFQPPGRMSAGVTRYITLWFCPKVSQDIVSTFPILAKTGRIDFPLRCTTKKTILTITPQDADTNPVVDFGQVLDGETCARALQVRNTGALAAAFRLEPEEPGNDLVPMISWKQQRNEFAEHATTKIGFTFTPKAGVVGNFSTSMKLTISNGAAGDALFAEEKRILIRGSCIDVPIYVEKETYDMKTCIFGHIFRESVKIFNRRSVPMKIEVEKPKDIEGELQVTPTLAYVQGSKEQVIQVKFSPKVDFLDRNPQYRDTSKPGAAFRIPVKIVGAEQVLPVFTELIGDLTTNDVRFEPAAVDFGRCFVGSSISSRLLVINDSLLPQRFVFTRLPGILSVSEVPADVTKEEQVDGQAGHTAVLEGGGNGAFGLLLPQERRQLFITYTPDAATEMDIRIQFKAITGQLCAREFGVACKGQGVASLLTLSHGSVEMGSIPCDTVSKESVVISNLAKVPYTMNLMLPPQELCGLKASPVCCTLAPGQSQRLQLEFRPTQEYVQLLEKPEDPPVDEQEQPPEAADGEEKPPQEAKAAPEEFRQERLRSIRQHGGRRWEGPDRRTAHASWKLPVFMRPQQATRGAEGAGKKEQQVMYLGVSTCVLPPILMATPAILDFGEVTAQQRKILPLTLQAEAGVEPQKLSLEALPESQCFTVLSAPRTGTYCQLMVEFHPKMVQIYQSVLQLRTQSTRVQVPLRGRGVRPVLKIEPEDGVLRLGSVVYSKECKDFTKKELVIKNDSPFELCYSLETVVSADPNHSGPPPFTLTPATGVVEANGSKTVTVTFRPHRPLALFREKVLVNVPNQKEPTYLYLYGHCFKYQTYAIAGMDFGPFARADAKGPAAFVDALSVGVGSGADPATGGFEYPKAQQTEFSLVFGEGERTQYLLLGAGVGQAAGNFDFQIQQSEFSKYFTVEAPDAGAKPDKAAKGALKPGELPIKVYFKYSPDENTSLKYGDVNLDLLGGIGQWITCKVKGVLSGGVVPQGEPPTQEISVELRAYLQQI